MNYEVTSGWEKIKENGLDNYYTGWFSLDN